MKSFPRSGIDGILVRSANWVGDAVMTMPVFRALRSYFPRARIDILAKPWVMPVFDHSPYIDGRFVYEAAGRHKRWGGIFRLIRDVKKEKYDLVVLLQNAFEAAFISYFSGIPLRLGYNTDGRTFLLNRPVKLNPEMKKRHQVHYYLGILELSGIDTQGDDLELFITENEKSAVENKLKGMGAAGKGITVGLGPGAEFGTAKRWFPERYAELSRKLIKEKNADVLIFGSPKEASIGDDILEKVSEKEKCFNLAGKTSLREAMAMIDCCDLFITNDSGLMHVAAALKKPVVAIFGSTNHKVTSPYGDTCHMVRHPVSCSPCMKPDCIKDRHYCMEGVGVDDVFNKAVEINVL